MNLMIKQFVFLLVSCLMIACSNAAEHQQDEEFKDELVAGQPTAAMETTATAINSSKKRIIVERHQTKDQYILYGEEQLANEWKVTYDTTRCTVGYNGIASMGEKREGDGKTPAGTYTLGRFFGYDDDLNLKTKNSFIDLEPNHYWMSDSSSPLYNSLIDYDPAPLEAEKMERNDHLYKYGIIINYNTDPVVPEKGSAIFLHIYRSPEKPTAGCVAVAEKDVVALMYWLDDVEDSEISIRP